MTQYEPTTRRFSRAEYDRMIELGVLDEDECIELLGGELMVAEPKGAPHYTAVVKTVRALQAVFGEGWYVRAEGPIGLDDESEPEPDVAVVPGALEDYSREHPSRPVLTVEIADSSLRLDRHRKGSLYARAGLADYWIVNLVDCVLEVYREPIADAVAPYGWRYGRCEVFEPSVRVSPLAMPSGSVPVSRLFP